MLYEFSDKIERKVITPNRKLFESKIKPCLFYSMIYDNLVIPMMMN